MNCSLSLISVATIVVPLLFTCAPALAQAKMTDDVRALLEKVATARGAARLPDSLQIEGTYEVYFGAGKEPQAKGSFREIYRGTEHGRHTVDMGAFGKMERGMTPELAWEIDPMMGAKRYDGPAGATTRRYFAILRGARPETLYASIDRRDSDDGLIALEMQPEQGESDWWHIDPKTHFVKKVELVLPSPDSAGAVFDMKETMDATLVFDDWREVDGVRYPHSRHLEMGPAKVVSTCKAFKPEVELAAEQFTAPDAASKLQPKIDAAPVGSADVPSFSIVDHNAQLVVSIRTECKPSEISATLAKLLPEVMARVTAAGGKIAGPPFSRYHSFGADSIDIEAGMPVAAKIEEKGRVKNSELPGGRVLTCWHIGPYDQLSTAHEAMNAHAAKEKLTAKGGPWEVYWTDPGMVPDPSKWRTQLFLPLAR